MERYDLRGELVRALRASGKKLDERKDPMQFQCVRHDDKTPSAWLGDHAWGCFSCGFEESLVTLADELGVDRPKRGFTVEEYADRKGFAVPTLARWGVSTGTGNFGDDVVVIPYRDAEGNLLRSKHRVRNGKSFWAGDGHGTYPYGLDILAKRAPDEPVILCEGESDCHAAWHAGVLAIGLPGANSWKPDWAQHFQGHPLYVWQEPGTEGVKMVEKVAASFPEVRVIQANGVKDLADLFREVGQKGMKAAVAARMAQALPAGKNGPTIPFDALIGATLDGILVEKLRPIDAVPTPILTWNTHCRDDGGGVGLARGWHIVVGANTGTGKSILALNLAAKATEHGERVAFVSLEMAQKQLATRFLALATGRTVARLEQGAGFDAEYWRGATRDLTERYERTGGALYTNRKRMSKLSDIVGAMRYQFEVNGCRYQIVDYLQLARTASRSSELYAAIEEVSNTVRDTAADLGVVSIGLSQFNRQTSNDRQNPPTPQGLMGGSPLENDADQVVLLDHSQFHRDPLTNSVRTRLMLAKNRHGGQAVIEVRWTYRDLSIAEIGAPGAIAPPPSTPVTPLHDRGEAWEPAEGDTSFPGEAA